MKRPTFKATMACVFALLFTNCATTQATQAENKFEKETIYNATFPCMSQEDAVAEIDAAIRADCERYGKDTVFALPYVVRCEKGIQVQIQYMCVKKETDEKK